MKDFICPSILGAFFKNWGGHRGQETHKRNFHGLSRDYPSLSWDCLGATWEAVEEFACLSDSELFAMGPVQCS